MRLDFTAVPARGRLQPSLAYHAADLGPAQATLTVGQVTHTYPVWLRAEGPHDPPVLLTARGYQGILAPGDRIALTGRRHALPGQAPFLVVDDAPGHHLRLLDQKGRGGAEHA